MKLANPFAFFARNKPARFTEPGATICGLRLSRHALCSNTLITGGVGSGKSSAGLLPAVTALLGPAAPTSLEVAGGLFLESKPCMCPFIENLTASTQRNAAVLLISPGKGSVRFNLINPEAVPGQAGAEAWDLVRSRWSGEPKPDPFFDDLGRALLSYGIEGLRMTRPNDEVTVADLFQLASDDAVNGLVAMLPQTESFGVRDFYTRWLASWPTATKATVYESIRATFAPFATDPKLRQQFCAHTNFSFRDCSEKNLRVLFHSDPEYYEVGSVVGMALKQRFLSMASARVSSAVGSGRLPLLVLAMDEAHQFLDDRSDLEWLVLTRAMRVVCLAASHSEAWFKARLGPDQSTVLLSQFGNRVWFANSDTETNVVASETCGNKLTGIRRWVSGGSPGPGAQLRYESKDFAGLDLCESVAWSFENDQCVRQTNRPLPTLT